MTIWNSRAKRKHYDIAYSHNLIIPALSHSLSHSHAQQSKLQRLFFLVQKHSVISFFFLQKPRLGKVCTKMTIRNKGSHCIRKYIFVGKQK